VGKGEIFLNNEMNTQEKVLHFSKKEFLQKGFKNASLRNIAASADMTTGAIYTYFKNKNALFESIVAPVCAQVDQMFAELSAAYYTSEGIVNEVTNEKTIAELRRIYRFIYDNFDIFRLLVVGAEGSSRADYVHTIVEYETMHTLAYLDKMKKGRKVNVKLNQIMVHIVSDSYINALFEPIRHNLSYEEAIENLDFLSSFYTGGWKSVFQEMFSYKS